MSEQESKVLTAVTTNPLASQQELASSLNMSRESIAGHIMRLTQKGKILGKGYLLPAKKSVVVIGGCNIDMTGRGYHTLISHDSNPGYISQSAGGVGRNIAENLARLGNDTSLISAIGVDPSGDWLLNHCRQANINMDYTIRSPQLNTGTYLALNDDKGSLQYAIADMAILDSINSQILIQKKPLLRSATFVLVEANISPSAIDWLTLQATNLSLYADAVSATKAIRLRPLLPYLTALKVNKEEAIAILSNPNNSNALHNQSNEDLIQQLLALGVQNVLLSLGEQGMLFANQQHLIQQNIYSVDPLSDTGAGDALFAGFMHGQLNEWPIKNTLAFASACAATTLACETANDPELTEIKIKNWMAQCVPQTPAVSS